MIISTYSCKQNVIKAADEVGCTYTKRAIPDPMKCDMYSVVKFTVTN
jgi:hypothetical protein